MVRGLCQANAKPPTSRAIVHADMQPRPCTHCLRWPVSAVHRTSIARWPMTLMRDFPELRRMAGFRADPGRPVVRQHEIIRLAGAISGAPDHLGAKSVNASVHPSELDPPLTQFAPVRINTSSLIHFPHFRTSGSSGFRRLISRSRIAGCKGSIG